MNMSWLLIDNAIISMVAADVLYRYANIAGSYYNAILPWHLFPIIIFSEINAKVHGQATPSNKITV